MKYLMCFLKSMLVFSMLFLLWEKDLSAQEIDIRRSHTISTPATIVNAPPATGTLDVVAIMVEFQPDTTRLTSGTGIFGPGGLSFLENAEDIRVEPLPHNQSYFEAHLEFAKNYFEQSSDDQLTIDYQVLPQVYRLDKQMQEYSPIGETFTNEKIAELARDAWQKVEENGGFDATGLDPERTAFVIFHAGVGRDIELTGTNLSITPYDIPSLYLRKRDLGQLLNDPSFDGFPINNGSFNITNAMILPRTESRRGLDIQDDEFVFPLSINGLLCASIGSHLGLPDLFDTSDGNPAIGGFGLMDGAGFFAYNGLLPPEPSAWEKIFLGWQNSFSVDTDTQGEITLEAASFQSQNNIARYNLSSSEYFLIENRHRDPDNTGVTLTIRNSDGTETQQTFTNNDDAFVFQEANFDSLFTPGVIVDVDNFDFSLPGGLDYGEDEEEDTDDDRLLNGGVLIWHIDEAMIRSQLQSGGVNSNRSRRGVDLEEADGAQDIGPGIPGAIDNSAAFGSAFDFWWSGNDYHVITETSDISLYENRFGPDTYPNNDSNTGSPSFFEFYDFSGNLPVASFKIRALDPGEGPSLAYDAFFNKSTIYNSLNSTYAEAFPLALSKLQDELSSTIIIPYSSGTLSFDLESGTFTQFNDDAQAQQPHAGLPLILANRLTLNQEINIEKWDRDGSGNWSIIDEINIPANKGLLSSENNETLEVDLSTYGIDIETFSVDPNFRDEAIQQSKIVGGEFSQATTDRVQFSSSLDVSDYVLSESSDRIYTGSFEFQYGGTGFFILLDGKLIMVNPDQPNPFKTIYESGRIGWPAIVDFNNDGSLDFIFADYTSNQLVAVNENGGLLDNFPYIPANGINITGTPLVADLEGDGEADIIIPTQDSLSVNIQLLDNSLQKKQYSPLYVGAVSNENAMALNPLIIENSIFGISHEGDLKGWFFENMISESWIYKYGNHPYNKVTGTVSPSETPGNVFNILNAEETYNWPNPASDYTHIRFEIAAPGGLVEIKVASLSGRIIFEKEVETRGAFPEEIRVNTQGWGSGGYFALVKATVNGETESKLIKIGVVH